MAKYVQEQKHTLAGTKNRKSPNRGPYQYLRNRAQVVLPNIKSGMISSNITGIFLIQCTTGLFLWTGLATMEYDEPVVVVTAVLQLFIVGDVVLNVTVDVATLASDVTIICTAGSSGLSCLPSPDTDLLNKTGPLFSWLTPYCLISSMEGILNFLGGSPSRCAITRCKYCLSNQVIMIRKALVKCYRRLSFSMRRLF